MKLLFNLRGIVGGEWDQIVAKEVELIHVEEGAIPMKRGEEGEEKEREKRKEKGMRRRTRNGSYR